MVLDTILEEPGITKVQEDVVVVDDNKEEIHYSQPLQAPELLSTKDLMNDLHINICDDTHEVNIANKDERIDDDPEISKGILDSGATVHIVGDKRFFVGKTRYCNARVKCANNAFMTTNVMGDVLILVNGTRIWLTDVLYIRDAPMLVSVGKLVQKGTIEARFKFNWSVLLDGKGQEIVKTYRKPDDPTEKLYLLPFTLPKKTYIVKGTGKERNEQVYAAFTHKRDAKIARQIIHCRYNHCCEYYVDKLCPTAKGELGFCDACAVGGLKNKKYSKTTKYPKSFDEPDTPVGPIPDGGIPSFSSDNDVPAMNPENASLPTDEKANKSQDETFSFGRKMCWDTKEATVPSVRGYRYAYIGVCTKTKVIVPLLGTAKNDFHREHQVWLEQYKNKYGRYPECLHFDQGGEFTDKDQIRFLEEKGIKVTFSSTKQSNQNSQAERKIGVIWTALLKVLAHSGVPFQFWCYAFEYVSFVSNHIPSRALNWMIPLVLAGMTTQDNRIFVFGCEVFWKDPNRLSHEAMGKRGVMLGLDPAKQGWRILDIESRKVVVTRNVVHNEIRMPFIEVMKPCLIMLKFGTWPKLQSDDTVNVENPSDPLLIEEIDSMRKGGLVNDLPQQTLSQSQPQQILSETILPQQDEPDCKHNLPLRIKENSPLSPIGNDTIDMWANWDFEDDDNFANQPSNDSPTTLNLDTPEKLSKKAKKKWIERKGNLFLKSTDKSRQRKYFKQLDKLDLENPDFPKQHSTRKPKLFKKKITLIPSIPEETVEGKPAWEVKYISRQKVLDDGSTKYYVRWTSKDYKDSWIDEKDLLGAKEAINDFLAAQSIITNVKTKLNTLQKVKVQVGTIPTKEIKPNSTIFENVAENAARISKSKQEIRRQLGIHSEEELKARKRKLSKKYGTKTTYSTHAMKLRSKRKIEADVLAATEEKKANKGKEILSAVNKLREDNNEQPFSITDTKFLDFLDEQGFTIQEDPNIEDLNFIELDFDKEINFSGENCNDDLEHACKASTEFPLPTETDLEGVYQVPADIKPEEIIAMATDFMYKLLDGTNLKKPENRTMMFEDEHCEEYLNAEGRELKELVGNNTWELAFCPEGRTPITCRWVYDIKRNKNNEVERFKARLVVQGFKQVEGIDFQKTFSSTAQMRSFRLICALSVKFGLKVTQYDISNAFTNSIIDNEVFMSFPPGYVPEGAKPNQCFRLLKGLYGLKQAARLWRELLVKNFEKAGLEVCLTESGVFHVRGNDLCLVNLHVDDYNIATANEDLRKQIEDVLAEVFEVKSLGDLNHFLGIVIEVSEDGKIITLHQKPYHNRLLEECKMTDCSCVKTPAEASVKLSVYDCPTEDEEKPTWPYINVGGSLMYSAFGTRPDITQRAIQLARFNSNPGKKHVKAQKHLLKYIKGTIDQGLKFTKPEGNDPKVEIIAFVDSDWAGCIDTRRSTVGWSVHICGGPISWKSQLKKTLALSSCEAEFMGLTDVAREIMWLTKFLTEIGVEYHTPKIFCDSRSAMYWAEDPVQHQRNKHVELKYYFIRDVVSQELVKLYKINTKYNVADLFTKPGTRTMINDLVEALMGYKDPILEE